MKKYVGATLVCLSALITASLTVGTTASQGAQTDPSAPLPNAAADDPSLARGLIVKTTTSTPSSALMKKTDSVLGKRGNVTDSSLIAAKVSTIDFSDVVSEAAATDVAQEVSKRSDVVWAVPNVRKIVSSNPAPVSVDDELFGLQRNVWDDRTAKEAELKSFPVGGYSVKAPELWQATKGDADVVVAVLDTGITEHPDLDNQVVPGYDFIHDDGARTSNDGDGWDPDPSDPGDWAENDECYEGSVESSSSWHGTHVTGIVAAEADNGIGVAGVSPGVSVQPIRVLGVCGGWDSDILAGITWASGGTVDGVPDNPTPAKVLNLSFGGFYASAEEAAENCVPYADAVAQARSRGAVVIASAGNEADTADTTVPAACPGVISVAASGEMGSLAWYSNVGETVDISAPGGNELVDDETSVWSTFDTGVQGPGDPDYFPMIGTSMAAPAVAAGAALIDSLGDFTPAQVERALAAATQSFPYRARFSDYEIPFGFNRDLNCTTSTCGAGILDLSRVPASIDAPEISGTPEIGSKLKASTGTWVGDPKSFTYQWLRDGAAIDGADRSTYRVNPYDVGTALSVRVSAVKSGFPLIAATAESLSIPADGETTTTAVWRPQSAAFGRDVKGVVSVRSSAGAEQGDVEIREGSTVIARSTLKGGKAVFNLSGGTLSAGTHTLQAFYLGGSAEPSASVPTTITVAKAKSYTGLYVPASIKITRNVDITVGVIVSRVARPTGTVTVYDGSDVVGEYPLVLDRFRLMKIRLPKFDATGTHRISVVYSGTDDIAQSKSSVRNLNVVN